MASLEKRLIDLAPGNTALNHRADEKSSVGDASMRRLDQRSSVNQLRTNLFPQRVTSISSSFLNCDTTYSAMHRAQADAKRCGTFYS